MAQDATAKCNRAARADSHTRLEGTIASDQNYNGLFGGVAFHF
jgi:hypothetical protein